jgi:hypothetical protein
VGGLLHVSGFWGAVIAGGINGAISGAAMGFAAGYAGGKGSLDDVLNKMWQGAVVGLLAGAVLGGASYLIKPPTEGAVDAAREGLRPQPGTPSPAGVPPTSPGGSGVIPPTMTSSGSQAGQNVVTGLGGKGLVYGLKVALTSEYAPVVKTLIVDSAAGAWDLYGMKLLYAIGVKSAEI